MLHGDHRRRQVQAHEPDDLDYHTRKNPDDVTDNTFVLPFYNNTSPSGYSQSVNWGDGKSTTFAAGEVMTEPLLTHSYESLGQYNISITTTQTDGSKIQMPSFNFSNNFSSIKQN